MKPFWLDTYSLLAYTKDKAFYTNIHGTGGWSKSLGAHYDDFKAYTHLYCKLNNVAWKRFK